tara:strand:- start:3604 stop:4365 length:762 start_codon:yes stop_codon:yes gene_type:complete
MNAIFRSIGYRLARYLSRPDEERAPVTTCSNEALKAALKPGDVLLVEGNTRISTAIKYITQSTWSHAALYVGKIQSGDVDDMQDHQLIEADITEGVRTVPLRLYCDLHVRICRPVGLTSDEKEKVITFMKERIGYQYDLKHIFDLARYLIQTPPVPQKHRRKLLALGSGDPTKAICSALLAEAFQSINYPILPYLEINESSSKAKKQTKEEYLHIRHHSLFAPRDFDVSPYFQIIKPTLSEDFDFRRLKLLND